jgi:cytochrome c-type biogenesis protein CcmH
MLWLVFVLLTSVAVLAVLFPLALNSTNRPKSHVNLHKKMLSDINQDIDCGLIDPKEADAIKTEGLRRMLLRETDGVQPKDASSRTRTVAAFIVCFFIPSLTVPLYMRLGRRDLHDQPLAARIASIPGHKDTLQRIVVLEKR